MHWYVYLAPLVVAVLAFIAAVLGALDPEGRGGKTFATGITIAALAVIAFLALVIRGLL